MSSVILEEAPDSWGEGDRASIKCPRSLTPLIGEMKENVLIESQRFSAWSCCLSACLVRIAFPSHGHRSNMIPKWPSN